MKKVTLRSKKRKNAMMLRQFLCVLFYWSAMLASTLPLTLVEEVRGNQVKQQAKTANAAGNKAPKAAGGIGPPPPSFVAVVPTSIMGDFDGGGLFPFVIEEETTTTTTTTTPAPFGTAKDNVKPAWVLVGGRASLACHHGKKPPPEQLATVLWYRGIKGEPIFTYDARDPNVNATSWSDNPPRGFGDRAQFDPSDVQLSVNGIQAQEGGLYRCRVDFQRSQTSNVLVNLTVIVPPDPPHILDPNGRRMGSLIGPYDEGEPLSITCISSKTGYPLPKLVWYTTSDNEQQGGSNPVIIADSSYDTMGGSTRNTLSIPRLQRSHFGQTFACIATNNNVTDHVATNVTIDMRLLPQTVTITPPTEPFSVSRMAVLECRSSGSRPPATITWWKRAKFMGKATEEYLRDGTETITRSRITFHPKPNDHERDVICRAENTNIPGSAMENTVQLTVHYPPKVRLSLGSSIDPDAISEGNDVYMDCEIRANPRVYKVEWSHNGMRVDSDPSSGVRILAGGKNLVIQGIQRRHTGNYTCTAFNLEGEDTSNAFVVTVMFKPECVHEEPVTLGVVPKRDAEVLCRMRSLPIPTRFRWTFNNSYEANEVPSDKYKSNGTLSKLNYRAESEKDFGVVHCWAGNMLGESSKPCIFTLIPAGPPDPPQNCDVHNHTTQGLSVTCTRGFGGGLEQTFHMEVRDRDSGHLLQNLSNSASPIFTVSEFKTSKGVSLSIYSSNSHGRSISQVHLETVPSKVAELQVETSSHSSSGNPHLLIGIMAGLLTTLVVLAFLIVVLLKVHTRRHPPPPIYSDPASECNNPSTSETPSRLNNAVKSSNSSSTVANQLQRKAGLFHTSSSSQSAGRHSAGSEQDPDLIPLQPTSKQSHLAARASNNDPQLYCQTGLEDRPPPPSLHQHYNRDYSQNSLGNKDYSQNSLGSKDYYHIAQPGNSGRPDIDPGDQMALAGNGNRDHSNSEQHHLSRPVIQQQHPPSTTLRMGPSLMATNNPTWPSRVNQFNEGNSNENNSGNNMVQSMSSTNSFSGTGVRTSVSMVSSNSNGGGAGKSGNGGWPVRLL